MDVETTFNSSTGADSTPVGTVLTQLFSCLDDSGIDYCILRNYKHLPNYLGNDVDMIIRQNSILEYEQVLVNVSQDLQWRLIKTRHRFSFHSYYLCYDLNDDVIYLKLDIWIQIQWKALTYASKRSIFESRKLYGSFWVASAGSEAAVSLFKEYLPFGMVKDKGDGEDKSRIAKLISQDTEGFLNAIQIYFGESIAHFVAKCAKNEDWGSLEKNVKVVRRALLLNSIQRRPIGQFGGFIRFVWGHFLDKVLHPSGLFICLIGPDGSGKSTIANILEDELKSVFSYIKCYHGRPGILPDLKVIYYALTSFVKGWRKGIGIRSEMEPSILFSKPALGPLRAMTHVLYYSIDYLLAQIIIQRTKAHGGAVIFDRYFYDYFIQPEYRNVPSWVIRTILFFLPKPDLLILLENHPDIVHKRKPELTRDEIKRQLGICKEVIKNRSVGESAS